MVSDQACQIDRVKLSLCFGLLNLASYRQQSGAAATNIPQYHHDVTGSAAAGSVSHFGTANASTNLDTVMHLDPALNAATSSDHLSAPRQFDDKVNSRSPSDDLIPFNDLQNPSDALDILAHIASNDSSVSYTHLTLPTIYSV